MPGKVNILLFNTSERKFWQRYLISLPEICKKQNWENIYKRKLKHELNSLSSNQIEEIRKKFGFKTTDKAADILANDKKSLEIFCYWRFSESYRSSIVRYLNLRSRGRELQKAAFVGILKLTPDELTGIMLYNIWRQNAIYERSYDFKGIREEQLETFNKKIRKLGAVLSRDPKRRFQGRPYHFKEFGKFNGLLIYWLLRFKSDEEIPAWPSNQRQKRFSTKVLVIDPKNNKMHLVVHNWQERRIMFGFVQKNLDIDFLPDQTEIKVGKAQLKQLLTTSYFETKLPIVGAEFKVSSLPGSPEIIVRDKESKSSITGALKTLEDKEHIVPNEIKNVKSFNILYNGQRIKVNIAENKLGYYKFLVPERNLSFQDRDKVLSIFSDDVKIPINKYFEFEGQDIAIKDAINSILNSNIIALSEEPPIYKTILETLYQMGVLLAPEKLNKRYCVNERCFKKGVNTWAKGSCSECGNPMHIYGEYFAIKPDKSLINGMILDELKSLNFAAECGIRIINGKKLPVIEATSSNKRAVTVVPINKTKIDSDLLEFLKYNDAAFVLIPYPYTSETKTIRENGIGVTTVTDIVYNKMVNGASPLLEQIDASINGTEQRIDSNWNNSLERIEKHENYNFDKFEEDIYSLLHIVLPTAQRLGNQFIGKRVPDGIAAIPLDAHFCATWDCKYSSTTYRFTESPKKIARYVDTLSTFPIVKTYGGLDTFIFISNNLQENKFRRFVKRVRRKTKWKGRFVLLSSTQVIGLSRHFNMIKHNLRSSPELNKKYYSLISDLFKRKNRKIYAISDSDISKVTTESFDIPEIKITRTEV